MAAQPDDVLEQINFQSSKKKEEDRFHWSMRLMSILSLLALVIYTYVLGECQRAARKPGEHPTKARDRRRVRLAVFAFALDLSISAYFSAATPVLLERGGITLDRKNMSRPLFWFFAISGFVPTASMSLTVIGGRRWREQIRTKKNWRIFHGIVAFLAYFSWWIACAPVFFISLVGEKRAFAWAREKGLLKAKE
jgi:hypothetical protein